MSDCACAPPTAGCEARSTAAILGFAFEGLAGDAATICLDLDLKPFTFDVHCAIREAGHVPGANDNRVFAMIAVITVAVLIDQRDPLAGAGFRLVNDEGMQCLLTRHCRSRAPMSTIRASP
ncbi:MAG: hypothetical protein ACI841_003307 [Planctomycetota bacterium]